MKRGTGPPSVQKSNSYQFMYEMSCGEYGAGGTNGSVKSSMLLPQ